MPHIVVAGPVSWNLLIRTDTLPRPEPHREQARWFHETVGGTSAGKALNLRRLGADVTLCTVVGDDEPGERILRRLGDAGVEVRAGRTANGSERHVNLMDAAGHRVSIYLTLPEAEPARIDPGLVEAADVVVVDLAEHSRPYLAAARSLGRPIWCDLHDYDGESSFHADFRDAADVVFVSDERLPDPRAFRRDLIAAGKRLVVCTRGADGAVALEAGGTEVAAPAERIADVVDTNGAGDAFFAGFLTAHLDGRPLRACLEQATRVAAACVRSADLV